MFRRRAHHETDVADASIDEQVEVVLQRQRRIQDWYGAVMRDLAAEIRALDAQAAELDRSAV